MLLSPFFLLIQLSLVLFICSTQSQLLVADEHGCFSSAGYTWCSKLDKCIRPWEVPELNGLYKNNLLTTEHVKAYCEKKVGSLKDKHGCVFTAGFLWCQKLNKCTRPWEVEELKDLHNSNKLTLSEFNNFCGVSTPTPPRVGGSDEHGCVSTAGYRWCQKLNKCVRHWETPELQSLSPTEIDNYCKPKTGGFDEHGCVSTAGYRWCQKLNKCVRHWETPELQSLSPAEIDNYCKPKTGGFDEHGCVSTAGYRWCQKLNKCVRHWETPELQSLSPAEIDNYCKPKTGGSDEHGCVSTAGYRWCQKLNKCVRHWETPELQSLSSTEIDNYCTSSSIVGGKSGNKCLSSAGYTWCEKLSKCIRPWEVKELKTLYEERKLSQAVVDQFCKGTPFPYVGGRDKYGCVSSAGFQWCAKLNKCVRSWELPELSNLYNEGKLSTSHFKAHCDPIVGGKNSINGCIISAGYVWCAKEGKCVRPWEFAHEKRLGTSLTAFTDYCN